MRVAVLCTEATRSALTREASQRFPAHEISAYVEPDDANWLRLNQRPQLGALVDDVRGGALHGVVVDRLADLSMYIVEVVARLAEMQDADVHVVAVRDRFDSRRRSSWAPIRALVLQLRRIHAELIARPQMEARRSRSGHRSGLAWTVEADEQLLKLRAAGRSWRALHEEYALKVARHDGVMISPSVHQLRARHGRLKRGDARIGASGGA